MMKLATAKEARMYWPALAVRRREYINVMAYVFTALLLAMALSTDGGARVLRLVELLVPAVHVVGCVLAIIA
ncbi:hypothetical protein E2562_031259 [Oryza meyeriana var. granulata]|uniref:Uncharacterized protein n=1 Tax=Oryza meyeriana var. granulata TaxID=110450 RepID=A0A6G1FEI8_9ORYZ|nr:hypothetical protein E2562_031259 [Oryza meyeriana var. granulata]